jgi:hypothetical protein
MGWIAVDFDGTLATYEGWEPVPRMVNRVKAWLADGKDVRIFTARVSHDDADRNLAYENKIRLWCDSHIGRQLPVTCRKDGECTQIWDDKAVRVIRNTGYSEDEMHRLKMKVRRVRNT